MWVHVDSTLESRIISMVINTCESKKEAHQDGCRKPLVPSGFRHPIELYPDIANSGLGTHSACSPKAIDLVHLNQLHHSDQWSGLPHRRNDRLHRKIEDPSGALTWSRRDYKNSTRVVQSFNHTHQ